MQPKLVAFLILTISSLSFSEAPSDSLFNEFLGILQKRTYTIEWEFYPLTLFPILKAQDYPWSMSCSGNYKRMKDKGNIACIQKDGTCYIGSKGLISRDSIYMYRSEKYMFDGVYWNFLKEYVIVTDFYGDIKNVLSRDSIDGHFIEVKLYARY